MSSSTFNNTGNNTSSKNSATHFNRDFASGAYTDITALLALRFAAQELSLVSPRNSQANLSGGSRTRFRGRGMEFEEVRVYQAGDDIRSIDWRVTARTQVPHTKLFREERERPTFIVADQRANLFFGSQRCFKSVLCARLAALVGWAALANSDRVGALVFGNDAHSDIRPRRSKHAVLELIHQLHQYNSALSSPLIRHRHVTLASMLEDTRRLAKPGSAVFFISDFQDFDAACEEQLYLLARHTDVTLFHVSDPLEKVLPNRGLLTISDGQNHTQLAAGDNSLRRDYERQFQNRFAHLQQCCHYLKIPLFAFSTADDEVEQIRAIYSKHIFGKQKHSKQKRRNVGTN